MTALTFPAKAEPSLVTCSRRIAEVILEPAGMDARLKRSSARRVSVPARTEMMFLVPKFAVGKPLPTKASALASTTALEVVAADASRGAPAIVVAINRTIKRNFVFIAPLRPKCRAAMKSPSRAPGTPNLLSFTSLTRSPGAQGRCAFVLALQFCILQFRNVEIMWHLSCMCHPAGWVLDRDVVQPARSPRTQQRTKVRCCPRMLVVQAGATDPAWTSLPLPRLLRAS